MKRVWIETKTGWLLLYMFNIMKWISDIWTLWSSLLQHWSINSFSCSGSTCSACRASDGESGVYFIQYGYGICNKKPNDLYLNHLYYMCSVLCSKVFLSVCWWSFHVADTRTLWTHWLLAEENLTQKTEMGPDSVIHFQILSNLAKSATEEFRKIQNSIGNQRLVSWQLKYVGRVEHLHSKNATCRHRLDFDTVYKFDTLYLSGRNKSIFYSRSGNHYAQAKKRIQDMVITHWL